MSASPAGPHRTGLGIALTASGFLLLPVMDAIAKSFHGDVEPVFLCAARFLVQGIIMLPIVLHLEGGQLRMPQRPLHHLLRLVFIAGSSIGIFAGVMLMPQADVTAISHLAPVFVALFAPVFLSERLTARQWLAISAGLVGVVIIIRPGSGVFGPAALLPLMSAVMLGLYMIWNRRLVGTASPAAMQLYAGWGIPLLLAPLLTISSLAGWDAMAWDRPNLHEWALIIIMGAIGSCAHLLIIKGAAHAPAPVLAPMMYLSMASAAGIGFLVFDEVPTIWTWSGLALIIGSGLWIVRHQRRLRPPAH